MQFGYKMEKYGDIEIFGNWRDRYIYFKQLIQLDNKKTEKYSIA